MENKVILTAIVVGFFGSAVLHNMAMPPIVVAVFLSTGISSLVYRFLGGLQVNSFNLGAVKLSGSVAALIACVWFINAQLVAQTIQPVSQPVVEHLGFNDIGSQIEHFIVTEKLGEFSEPLDLDPLPFHLKTKRFGGEYSRFQLLDKSQAVIYDGAIYRRQAQVIKLGDDYYVFSVVAVNHNPG
ncbi:hypothetical protein DID80_08030, partial [Candidatus Marinamargulisbacteria bacterium SCGC AAA071-K20]